MNAENEYVKGVKNYVHQSFFEAYRDNPGKFCDSVIKLGVEAMECQNTGFLATGNPLQIDAFWKAFVETYLGTGYMPQAGALLTKEAVTMLQWLYDRNEVKDAVLMDTVLKHADEGTLRGYLHTMMNDRLSKTNINKVKFLWFGKLLPQLGADMETNVARGLMTYFIKPVCKDAECAAVIVEHKAFYLAVMKKDEAIAGPIAKEMAGMEAYAAIAGELKAMVKDEKK